MISNNTKGYYFGRYEIAEEAYSGDDFSRRCFVFPGQGFAFPGMFRQEYYEHKEIRETVAQADDMAKRFGLGNVSDYIVAPEHIRKEQLPIVRNLALFTLEVALSRLLVAQKIVPMALTGHSYGEYAVLVAAGVLSFEDALAVAYHRDHFAPPPNEEGFMIAIAADESTVRATLEGMEFHVSNLNAHTQTVVSVRGARVEEAKKMLERKGLKHKVLMDVPQPYHSPYLNEVRDAMRRYVDGKTIKINKPHTPFVSSVTHAVVDERHCKGKDIRRIMTEQITEPVRFIEQIEHAYGLGCRTFVDVLGTNSFGGFIKNILAGKNIKIYAGSDLIRSRQQRPARAIAAKDSKLFALVSRIIGEITGYEIEKISLEDRYQEDMGIDSIKKADILLTVLSESKIDPGEDFNVSQFGSVGDTVAYLEHAKKHGPIKKRIIGKKEPKFGRYLFAWEEKPLIEQLLIEEGNGGRMDIALDEIYKNTDALAKTVGEFLGRNSGATVVLHAGYQEVSYEKAMAFYAFWRGVAKHIGKGSFTVLLIATGKRCPLIDGYGSFLKSMKKELPGMFFKQVRVADEMDGKQMDELTRREAREPFDIDVLYEGGVRLVSTRILAPINEVNAPLDERSVVIAIGGAKGITFSLLRHIAEQYRPVIRVVGKSSEQDATVGANMAVLRKYSTNARYDSLDARDFDALEALFASVQKEYGRIDMVINGAGVVDVALLKDKTRERAEDELSAKLLPAMHVLELRKTYRQKRTINFASVIAKYGSAGQCVYTMANEIVAGISAPYGDVCVVHWPAWEETGMTARGGISKNLERLGVPLLKPNNADALFAHELATGGAPSVYYMDEDDDARFGFGLHHLNAWEPLIGTFAGAVGMSVENPAFERVFDQAGSDGYLRDHRIRDVGYVPASVMASMFLCVGKMRMQTLPTLKDFVVRNPVKVGDEPVVCRLNGEWKEQGEALSIWSNIVHALCRLQKQATDGQATYAIPVAKRMIAPTNLLYAERLGGDSLYLGKTFQVIEQIAIDDKGDVFTRVNTATLMPILHCGPYDRTAQWIESALQTLGAAAAMKGQVCIPISIAEISVRFEAKNSRYLYGIPMEIDSTAEGITGSVVLVNEQGEPVLTMRNCFMKKISDRSPEEGGND